MVFIIPSFPWFPLSPQSTPLFVAVWVVFVVFVISVVFAQSTWLQNIGLAKPRLRNTRFLPCPSPRFCYALTLSSKRRSLAKPKKISAQGRTCRGAKLGLFGFLAFFTSFVAFWGAKNDPVRDHCTSHWGVKMLLIIVLATVWRGIAQLAFPKGPKIEKIQDRPPGLKFSSEIEIFKRATRQTPIFCGEFWRSGIENFKLKDWNFQSRLIISIEIDFFFHSTELVEGPRAVCSLAAGVRNPEQKKVACVWKHTLSYQCK